MPHERQPPGEFSPEEMERYCEAIRRTWVRRTGDGMIAEDLAQQTALVALERLHRKPLQSPEKLGAFMHQTAKNIHWADKRKQSRRRTSTRDVDSFRDDSADPERLQLLAERQSLVWRALKGLRIKRDRDILTRRILYRQTKAEICASLDVSAAHFDRVLARARRRLLEAARRITAVDF